MFHQRSFIFGSTSLYTTSTMPLYELSDEPLLNVTTNLDYPSTIALRWTCRELRDRISHPDHVDNKVLTPIRVNRRMLSRVQLKYNMVDLLQIELWPAFNYIGRPGLEGLGLRPCAALDWFACHICLKLRSAIHFTNAMMKRKRGKLSPVLSTERCKRLCIDCGIRTGQYRPGIEVEFGGAGILFATCHGTGVVCCVCRSFRPVLSELQSKLKKCRECLNEAGVRECQSTDFFLHSSSSDLGTDKT